MSSPRERVRANIYKTLLEEEKRKGKKMSMVSLSLFVVGVFTGSSYDLLKKNIAPNNQTIVALESKEIEPILTGKETEYKIIDDLFQVDQIKIHKQDFNSENLFVSELQI
nr:hypothetical protein [uncultured Cetobacterium sp.]